MRYLPLYVAIGGLLTFTACKKSDDNSNTNNNNPTKSKKDLIVDGKWQWSGLAVVLNNNGKDSLVDSWSQVKDCDKDDVFTYSANGTGTIDEMATKCKSTDPQTKNVTWELINNETQVKVTDDEGTHLLTIIELTATQAKYRQRVSTGSDSATVQQTFKNIK